HRIRERRAFEILLLELTWRWPRFAYRHAGTDRLQMQLRLMVLLAIGTAGAALAGALVLMQGRPILGLNPAFLLMWVAGGGAAIGAAWMAKYHRFAALVLLGGAGVTTCL